MRVRVAMVVAGLVAGGLAAGIVTPVDAAAARPAARVLARSGTPAAVPLTAPTARSVWPAAGQAAYVLGGHSYAGPDQHVAPIASMAKVMTALIVLRRFPLPNGEAGFTMTVTARDVADYHLRVGRGESTVPVAVGERITEKQALAALLLPSANNIAIMLARFVSGTVARFVQRMNWRAAALELHHTVYTDPSGFDPATRSTAADQARLALFAIRRHTLRGLVKRPDYWVPVAGTVHNTDTLLGTDGFLGIKTGSMTQSGGCFMFRSMRIVNGRHWIMLGVVMGQPGGDLIAAGLNAAKRLVDAVAPRAG